MKKLLIITLTATLMFAAFACSAPQASASPSPSVEVTAAPTPEPTPEPTPTPTPEAAPTPIAEAVSESDEMPMSIGAFPRTPEEAKNAFFDNLIFLNGMANESAEILGELALAKESTPVTLLWDETYLFGFDDVSYALITDKEGIVKCALVVQNPEVMTGYAQAHRIVPAMIQTFGFDSAETAMESSANALHELVESNGETSYLEGSECAGLYSYEYNQIVATLMLNSQEVKDNMEYYIDRINSYLDLFKE